MSGVIGYENLLNDSDATVTALTEATGFDKEYAYDWRPYDWWKPTATGDQWIRAVFTGNKSVDYFAVAAHDLSTKGSTIKLQYSTNSGSTWNDATTATGGTSDRVIFETFTSISADYWRVLVNNPTTIASIGIVSFGARLDLARGFPVGFSPPALARVNEYQTSMTDNGQFIGRSVSRKTYDGSFSMDTLTPSWVRTYWEPFIDHAETKPFFLSWDDDTYPEDAVICWMKDQYRPPSYDSTQTMRVQLEFNARRS